LRILLVEDDRLLGDAVRDYVSRLGHAVDWTQRLTDADAVFSSTVYNLVLLDLRLPDGSGLQLLRRIQNHCERCLCIILSARDQVRDRVSALNSGADDYLVKPFDLEELGARIKAVFRRHSWDRRRIFRFGETEIDIEAKHAKIGESAIILTSREWAVLEKLMQRPGALVPKQTLEDAIYSFGAEIESNAIEVYVSRLRRKLGRGLIQTSRGMGYRLAVQ
jgi:two-component system OmpR family response regulator